MPLILPGNVASATAVTGYSIDNSCRFNDDDSAHMTFTLGAESDRDRFTISCWVKRSQFGIGPEGSMNIIHQYTSGDDHTFFKFVADDSLIFFIEIGASLKGKIDSSALYRDPAAWMHAMVVYDSANADAGNRMRMYVNGTEVTSFANDTNPSSGQDSLFYDGKVLQLGRDGRDDEHFDGYMAEVIYCDGQALTPSSFGEFNEDSPTIWQPIDPSGVTFGNNGFWLDFKNSAALGNDVSGNDNDWTPVNLAATDQCTDSPTNNFCTLNPLDNFYAGATLSEGNCKIATASSPRAAVTGTFGMTTGKWYYELIPNVLGGSGMLAGISDTVSTAAANHVGIPVGGYGKLSGQTNYYNNDTGTTYGTTYAVDDVLSVAIDLDNSKLYFAKNGTWMDDASSVTGVPTSGASGTGAISITAVGSSLNGLYFPSMGDVTDGGASTFSVNFGNPPYANSSDAADGNGYGAFEYAPPSGYLAICTKNLGSDGG